MKKLKLIAVLLALTGGALSAEVDMVPFSVSWGRRREL
jgi:hypothetical protein